MLPAVATGVIDSAFANTAACDGGSAFTARLSQQLQLERVSLMASSDQLRLEVLVCGHHVFKCQQNHVRIGDEPS
jgi:hypothetical protein